MDSFTELGKPRDLAKIFESAELVKWRSFRESEDSRYVALTLPHILMRLPYGPDTSPVEGFNFEEDVDGRDHSKYLWGNAAYALAHAHHQRLRAVQWCAAIRGVEGGGLVEGLPTHTFQTDEGDVALKCPTEIAITDRREKELNDLGFIALVHCKDTDYAAFFGGQTAQKPKVYNTAAGERQRAHLGQLPYILAASRFAHYIKAIMRDKIGSFMTRDNVAKYLNRWIAQLRAAERQRVQSSRPSTRLREARVDVTRCRASPAATRRSVFLRPHFQLEELTASIRLVAELPPPAAA